MAFNREDELRERALEFAQRAHWNGTDDEVLAAAKKYYYFLVAEDIERE